MATAMAKTRTNYFAVTDKEAFRTLVNNLVTSEGESVTMMENKDGEVGFCVSDTIYGLRPKNHGEDDGSSDDLDTDVLGKEMVRQIRDLLSPGHACIITEIGWENLRSVTAYAYIITKDDSHLLDLWELACEKAGGMLGNPKYSPQTSY